MAYEVERVVGSGSVQELICQPITFPKPAEEVKEIRKTVIIDNCLVVYDKVIVDGRLRKDIMFKQACGGFPIPGNVAACSGVVATVSGPIYDVDVDIAFNALIPVPGAKPGDKCVFLQAFVEGEKEEAANINADGSFCTLLDKSIVFLCVKATVSKRGYDSVENRFTQYFTSSNVSKSSARISSRWNRRMPSVSSAFRTMSLAGDVGRPR